MKSFKQIALSALLTLGAFGAVTYTSCNKDECKDVVCENGGTCSGGNCNCLTGFDGTNCEIEVRTTYAGTYRGNGTDSDGGTYTDWGMTFTPLGTNPTEMGLNLVDANNAPQLNFTVELTSNTAFAVVPKTNGNFSYTGSGTIDEEVATLSLSEVESGGTTTTIVYTFNNMIKP